MTKNSQLNTRGPDADPLRVLQVDHDEDNERSAAIDASLDTTTP